MYKYTKDLDIPFKQGRYVYLICDNDLNTIKSTLESHPIKIINNDGYTTIDKYNGKYYDRDSREQINLSKHLLKFLSDDSHTIVLTTKPDDLINGLMVKKRIELVFNEFDNELIEIDYFAIVSVLLKHSLIGGRVGSFMGVYDNKTLQYVYGYDLKKNKCYGVRLDMVLSGEDYTDLCDHIIALYKEHKDKPIPVKDMTERQTYGYISVNHFGNLNECD